MQITEEWLKQYTESSCGRSVIIADQKETDSTVLIERLISSPELFHKGNDVELSKEEGLHLACWLINRMLPEKERDRYNRFAVAAGLGMSLKGHFLFQERVANFPQISRSDDPKEQERLEKLSWDMRATHAADVVEVFHGICVKQLELVYYKALRELIDYGLYLLEAIEDLGKDN